MHPKTTGQIAKAYGVLLLDAQSLADLQAVVGARLQYYSRERQHSRLGYLAPQQYVDQVQGQP